MLSLRFKDVLSARLRSNLPAGHSVHSVALEEALMNDPSEHGSNVSFPKVWLANPDCLKADSNCSLATQERAEMLMYWKSWYPLPLKWKKDKKNSLSRG